MKNSKTLKSLLSGTLAITLLLTGCTNKKTILQDPQSTSSSQTTSSPRIQSYGQTVSVADSEREYYTANVLCASSAEEFRTVLFRCLASDGHVISIKFTDAEFPQDDIINAVKDVYNTKGMDDKLPELGFAYTGGCILPVGKDR